MTEIFDTVTSPLILQYTKDFVETGCKCLICGFVLFSILSFFSYGIIQTMRLFNIKNY